MNKRLFFFTLSLLLLYRGYGAQPSIPKFHLAHYTDENGLPQNSIIGMAFDNMGFAWIATQAGLVRFDGHKMAVYAKTELGLPSSRFLRFSNDVKTGELQAVSEFGQLVSIRNGHAFTRKGQIVNTNSELAAVWKKSGPVSQLIAIDSVNTVEGYPKYGIISDVGDKAYVFADQKVAFLEDGAIRAVVPFDGPPWYPPLSPDPRVRPMVIRRTKGNICADNFMIISGLLFYHWGSEGPALEKISKNGHTPVRLSGDILRHPAYATMHRNIRIIPNRFKAQAFAYLSGCTYQIHYSAATNSLTTTLLIEDLDIDDSLIYRMLYDERSRALFMGSLSQGLFVARPNAFRVLNQFPRKDFANIYYSYLPYTDSSVVIPEGYVIGSSDKPEAIGGILNMGRPAFRSGMLRDRQGYNWVIKSDSICRLSRDARTVSEVWGTGRNPERLYEGMDGSIWAGFKTGELARLSPDGTGARKFQIMAKLKSACTFIYEDQPGQIWVGTKSGLFLYDVAKQKAFPVKSLAGKEIRSIVGTGESEIWITTYGDGFYLLKDNRLTRMPLDEKEYLAYAHCILEDERGYLWLSSNKGLFRASREDLKVYAQGKLDRVFYMYYNKEDGFVTNEFNGGCQPCGLKMGDGHFSFPSMNGLLWFKPGDVPLPNLAAPLRLESFKLDDRPVPAGDTLRLPYDYQHLYFELASHFIGLADNLEYYYALHGPGDKTLKWERVGDSRTIDVYQLKAGTHTLIVRKAAGFGGRFIEKRLTLIVERAWFLSWWFIVLVVTALGLLFWLFTKWRLRSVVRQNAILSEKIAERTEHLSRTLDELKASDDALRTQLQVQMRIIGVLNHDLHGPLRYLNMYVPRFLEQVAERPEDPDTKRLGKSIGRSTTKVFRLADDLLGFIKATYQKKGKIIHEPVSIFETAEKKIQFFSDLAHENNVSVSLSGSDALMVNTNRIMAEILIHNLLDNAIKHSFSHEVSVKAARGEDRRVSVTIHDTGSGMSPHIIDWLNDHETSLRSGPGGQASPPPELGLGLIIVKEIVALLEIGIKAISDNKGTSVTLAFSE